MPRAELVELWRSALNAAREGLGSGGPEARAAARRVARSILAATGGQDQVPEIHRAAQSVVDAEDDRVAGAMDLLVLALQAPGDAGPIDRAPILIVDDDAVTRRILDEALSPTGRRIIHAATAAEAQRWLESERLALIILDLVLPDADGRNLLISLRDCPRTAAVPVFIVSGQVGLLPRAECLALGADGFFEKPFDPHDLSLKLSAAIQQAQERRHQALRDALTGLPNRTALGELYEALLAQSNRSGESLSLALIDLDGLKSINDTAGHHEGDQAIQRFARTLRAHLRGSDVLTRWGGDEFVALVPGVGAPHVADVLERCQAALKDQPPDVPGPAPRRLSFSAGVAEVATRASLEQTLEMADRRVYAAKARGRGRVVYEDSTAGQPSRQVLLAEDDAVTAAIVRDRLARAGLQIHHCPDGQQAWDSLQSAEPYSLAILDVQMPGIDGIELLRRIRLEPRLSRLPVLMLTGLGNEQDVVRAFDAGTSDYMAKPFSPAELVKRVNRLLK